MPASRWTRCLALILKHEGGYVDHPADPGGATNMGITHKTLARWRGVSPWWDVPKSEVAALTRAEAAAIYKAQYWDRSKAGSMPAGLDLALFDYAVNSGPDRAIRALQALVGVVQDGFVGPVTLAAIAKRDTRTLVEALCDQRMSFLQRLSTWASFGRGWTSRVADIRANALADVPLKPLTSETIGVDDMSIFDGHKTYIVGALMLLVGMAQSFGLEIDAFGGMSGPHLVMEALAVIFLRRGLKSELGKV
ncbi:glycoside hydrolase family 108 protein [Pelagibacterium luteolum]|uniref:Predicted Peptidoglycan domain-containing protein n=1 Tax=Pelagibacterium luteolum TaxID=440168 RepID=A0A1G7TMY3_9HYPH|nr:glycosyl hydrolase 108 family protein [Pelagibacterium luteolum]SDG36635.1 Predicted Peptidoglycan domain-containing protein [Pelagibacterium luteolum]